MFSFQPKHVPQARIVADRFHGIRIVNHRFLACWKELNPVGSSHSGLVSLIPAAGTL